MFFKMKKYDMQRSMGGGTFRLTQLGNDLHLERHCLHAYICS
jgi:hypothetical protein